MEIEFSFKEKKFFDVKIFKLGMNEKIMLNSGIRELSSNWLAVI